MERNYFEVFRLRHGDTLDKILFGTIAFGGMIGLYLARSIGLGEVVVETVLIAAMIFYVGAAHVLGKLKLRPDQIGDNCYYLGFIYTLASLGYSLHSFSSYSRNLDAISSIIANFGIAIFTTMAGIIIRVILHQMRVDPADIEQEARLSLAGSALRVRAELDEVVLHFNSFRAATQQSIAEAFEDIAGRTGDALTVSTKSVEDAVHAASVNLDRVLIGFTENSGRLEENSNKLNHVIATLVEKIDSIDASPDLISRKLEPGISGIDKLVKRLERRMTKEDERAEAVDQLLQRSAATMALFEKAATAAERNAEKLGEVTRAITSVDKETARFGVSARSAADALASFEKLGPKVDESISSLASFVLRMREGTSPILRSPSHEPIVVTRAGEHRVEERQPLVGPRPVEPPVGAQGSHDSNLGSGLIAPPLREGNAKARGGIWRVFGGRQI